MKRSEKGVLGIILAATLMVGATAVVSANGGTLVDLQSIKSIGKIQVKENETDPDPAIVIDSADLVTLANATNELNNQYTNALADAVNNIGSVPKTDRVAAGAQFSDILSAITNSQAIDSSESVYVLPNGTVTDDSTAEGVVETQITGATEANLSAGTAAWVDGQLIVGTGADNNSYYALGYKQGKQENNNIVNLGGYGTYDLTQYDNYAEFAINKNIFITVNSISVSSKLSVGDAAGGLHFSASNSGQPYTATYSNGILEVVANNISCSTIVKDPYEDVGTISGKTYSDVTVYLLP